MIGICIELKTSCSHCSSPIMLNAFTELILCNACGKNNRFSQEEWKNLLEDAMKEAPGFEVGAGQPSTIMRGTYTYSMMYGRQDPRCSKCKTGIDMNKLEQYSSAGKTACKKCGNMIFIRKPDEFIAESFPQVKFLAGEDADMLSSNPAAGSLPSSAKPVLFTCPSCAGNLEIDGSDRMVTCKFCSSQIYLPDDLWFRLHPATEVARWYMTVDEDAVPMQDKMPEWYYLPDMLSDRDGNTYFATAMDETGFIVWSIDNELNTRWARKGLKYDYEHANLAIAPDGNLFVWSSESHSLTKISSADGKDISKLEGDKSRKRLNMKGCARLVSCGDGTLLTIINHVFARFSEDGERLQLWEAKKLGLFSVGEGDPIPDSDGEYAPYVKDVGNIPKRINGDFTYLNIGMDGYLYMLDRSSSDGEIAKYEQSGAKVWSKYIPLNYKEGRPVQDERGYIYFIGTDDKSNTRIVRFNIAGDSFETIIKDLREGGKLEEEDKITVLPDGTIIAAKFYNRLKVFSPSFEMIYRSEQSKKDDEEEMRRRKDKVESDEEFED